MYKELQISKKKTDRQLKRKTKDISERAVHKRGILWGMGFRKFFTSLVIRKMKNFNK